MKKTRSETETSEEDPQISQGVDLVNQAAHIRSAITQMYQKYRALTAIMCDLFTDVSHKDIKAAVDAIHYLGGVGYPYPNSPGRMEALLDKMIGMYRVLTLIGQGALVENHLKSAGITIKMDSKTVLQDAKLSKATRDQLAKTCQLLHLGSVEVTTVSELYKFGVDTLNALQSDICNNSNVIRKEIKPTLAREVGLEREEIKRGIRSASLRLSDRVGLATGARRKSTGSYRRFMSMSKRIEGIES